MKNFLKKTIVFLLCFGFLVSLPGCSFSWQEPEDCRLRVVSSVFPTYDFARQIAGDRISLSMLLRPGTESHSYEPTAKDMIALEHCDVFLCTGGEGDQWVEQLLGAVSNPNLQVVRMVDCVPLLEEEAVEGMLHHHEEEEHSEHGEFDEHVWASPVNAAAIAEEICARLKAPKKLTEETAELVKLHMYDFRCDARENKIRKFIIENVGILDKLLLIKQADYSACTDDFSVAPSVEKISKIYAAMKSENVPFALKELAVKGNDLIEAGVPAQEVGNTLLQLLTDCAIKLCENDREKILTRLKKVYMPTLNPAVYAVYAQKFAEEEAEKRSARAVAVADKKRLRAEKYGDGKRKKSSPKSS